MVIGELEQIWNIVQQPVEIISPKNIALALYSNILVVLETLQMSLQIKIHKHHFKPL